MTSSPRVLAIIPARGGSKGVPRKNIKPLGGRPLLAYTVEAALAAKRVARLIVSTEDEEIASVARGLGVDVPFLRPAELAEDRSPTLPVIQHALTHCERSGARYDAVCLLQPTVPFRTEGLVDGCIELLESREADTVITVERVPHAYNPEWVFLEEEGALRVATGRASPIPRRQDLPAAFHRTGSVYVVRRETLMDEHTLFGPRVVGFETPVGATVNIDTLEDWALAEERLAARS